MPLLRPLRSHPSSPTPHPTPTSSPPLPPSHSYLVRCHPTPPLFPLILRFVVTFFVVLAAQLLGSLAYGGNMVLLWFLLLGPVLLLTVLVHELGHCLAARSVGSEVQGILLWPLGGLAFIGKTPGPKGGCWDVGGGRVAGRRVGMGGVVGGIVTGKGCDLAWWVYGGMGYCQSCLCVPGMRWEGL